MQFIIVIYSANELSRRVLTLLKGLMHNMYNGLYRSRQLYCLKECQSFELILRFLIQLNHIFKFMINHQKQITNQPTFAVVGLIFLSGFMGSGGQVTL